MPEGNIGGKYKNIAEADAGIAEMEALIGTLKSDRDTARNKTTELETKVQELSKPRTPKFKDDSGADQVIGASTNLQEVFGKFIKGEAIDDATAAKIGAAVREGDDAFIGRAFIQLRGGLSVAQLKEAQTAAINLVGADRHKQMTEWLEKSGSPEQKAAYAKGYNTAAEAQGAVRTLLADFTLGQTKRSPGETSPSVTDTGTTGYATPPELQAAREKARATHGPDYLAKDPEFARRLAVTDRKVKEAPIGA